ncbi:MAG: hypothetical protein M5U34_34410 [Chloroflexi bacterium]|nr:hypothetical protein [Chloroflexota bacterium]
MRHSLLASMLEIMAENSRFQEYIALFEVGKIYLAAEEGVLPDELNRLSLALTGPPPTPPIGKTKMTRPAKISLISKGF